MCRGQKHLVRHDARLTDNNPEPDAREDVGIVSLSGNEDLVIDSYRVERAAARENRTAVRLVVRLLSRTLGFRGRIRERENNRSLVDLGHRLNDGLGET